VKICPIKKTVDVGKVWWFWFTTNAFAVDKTITPDIPDAAA